MENLKNKKIVILGLGRSGAASASFLKKAGANVTISDQKKESELTEFIQILGNPKNYVFEFGGHTDKTLLGADQIVVSPGVPMEIPVLAKAREKGIEIIGEIELAYNFIEGKIIGITGTKGKTTTTTLTGEIFKKAGKNMKVGGNIGKPLTSMLNGNDPTTAYIAELSSFQLEGIKDFKPDIAAILNVTSDHMDRYKNIQDYVEAKSMIFSNQDENDILILNSNDKFTPIYMNMAESDIYMVNSSGKVEKGAFLEGGVIKLRINNNETSIIKADELLIKGMHNVENAMFASLICSLSGINAETITNTLKKFEGVEHRQEFVAKIKDITFINNSQGTNMDAVKKSLLSYDNPIILIMGGRNKNSSFAELRETVTQKVKKVVLIGEAAKEIRYSLKSTVEIADAGSMEDAVETAFNSAKESDIVLLSPGCSSFDMFKNYEERGRIFKQAVLDLKSKEEKGS